MNFQGILLEKLYGSVNRFASFKLFNHFMILLAISFFGCTTQKPLLKNSCCPISYRTQEFPTTISDKKTNLFNIIAVNNEFGLNDRVIGFWRKGEFQDIVKKKHPYLSINSSNISVLAEAINYLFDIYYVDSEWSSQILSWDELESYASFESCIPLNNTEIQFLMNTDPQNAFPAISLTMVLITVHELMLQKGAIPISQKVQSAYLINRFGLQKKQDYSDYNVYANRDEHWKNRMFSSGFVFCRKQRFGKNKNN